jgi:glycosyltransferase involved in cell wall biosynthesis
MAEGVPAVTVIMPVRNGAPFIAEAIRSCLSQTEHSFELIVADDGSTDDSLQIARCFRDDRIVVLPGGPSNPSAARNRAISVARGEYVAFLDADDMWYPTKLERQLVEFADPSVVAVGAVFRYLAGTRAFGILGRPLDEARLEQLKLGRFMPVTTSSLMFRRSTLAHVGPFDEDLARAADLDMLSRLARTGRIVILTEVMGEYRIHGGGVSRQDPAEHQRWMRFVGERIDARDRGSDLTWEEFNASQKGLSPAERRRVRSAALYREAGNIYAAGRRGRGIVIVLHAFVVDPRYTTSKVWQQKPWRIA